MCKKMNHPLFFRNDNSQTLLMVIYSYLYYLRHVYVCLYFRYQADSESMFTSI